ARRPIVLQLCQHPGAAALSRRHPHQPIEDAPIAIERGRIVHDPASLRQDAVGATTPCEDTERRRPEPEEVRPGEERESLAAAAARWRRQPPPPRRRTGRRPAPAARRSPG